MQPAFLICAVILAMAGSGMSVAVKSFGVYLKKEPYPLKKSLDLLDEKGLAPYEVVSKDKIGSEDVIDSLGTKDYMHGGVVSWNKHADKIKRATFPGMVSNHHLHALAGVTIACAEMLEFGKDYVQQVVKNSKALGQALYERGFKVLAEHKGFTESHVIIIDITKCGDGGTIEGALEKANIILNRNLLPWDIKEGRHFMNPGGIRMGTSEVTRLGMKENEMKEIAEYIKRIVINKENAGKVKADVAEFRKDFQKVHYCFENATQAYDYVKIR